MKQIKKVNEVQYYRELKSLSQEDLAKKSGISEHTIWNIEKGKSIPRPSTRRKIAEALNTPVEKVFPHPKDDPIDEDEPAQIAC